MKQNLLLIAIACMYIVSLGPCFGAEKVLQSWDFTKAADTLGWQPAEAIKTFKVAEGALTGTAGPGRPKLESPLFDIIALPSQSIEIEMKTDAGGSTLVYYSSTTGPPYGGFRPQLFTSFTAKGDGEFHKYILHPFWQKEGKIVHIRIDPPGDNFAVRSIRLLAVQDVQTVQDTSWDFKGSDKGWQAMGSGTGIKPLPTGLAISGNNDLTVISPLLSCVSDNYPWATIRLSSKYANTALFQWASDNETGLQSIPIRLIGDSKMHSYSIELSEVGSWSGKIRALALTPSQSMDKSSVVVESVALGSTPVGPAELQITHLGFDTPIVRAGEKAKVVAEVRNSGGAEANLVEVSILQGVNKSDISFWESTKSKSTSSGKNLAPGVSTQTVTDFLFDRPGLYEVTCIATADGITPVTQSAKLRVYPEVDTWKFKGVKYVPQPKPADTGDYLVGCYNFPGWRDYGAWSVLDNFPERRPVLGYYNDGSPEVTDWQINWAVAHGIGFFIYDWYWSAGGRHLEEGLNDGFLKSRYNDKMKFCLLWANHNPAGTHSEKDMEDVTKYWIDNYFKRPNYLKVGGKNVIVIFAAGNLTTDLGKDTVKKCFDKMRKMCEDAGVGGLYMVACSGPWKDYVDTLLYEGYDAISGYNYPWAGDRGQLVAPYSWMVDGYKNAWKQMSELSSVPYIPLCEAGWDSRPWHGATARVRTGKSPELFEKMLRNAKAYDDDPSNKLPEGKKLVFIEAWNEYGEGDYIEPHAEYGFDYLEAVRKVFAPKSKQPEIVLPKDLGMGPYDLPKPTPKTAWDFSKKEDRGWYVGNMNGLSYEGDIMSAQALGTDPAFYSPMTEIDAARLKTLEIKMKTDATDSAQIFFARPRGSMAEDRSVQFNTTGDNEWHVYTVDMSQSKYWRGLIGALRLDPNSTPNSRVEIAYIKIK